LQIEMVSGSSPRGDLYHLEDIRTARTTAE
jgi:hypothetical protein